DGQPPVRRRPVPARRHPPAGRGARSHGGLIGDPMSYADVPGISLYYEEHGSGQPLILLHGGYGSGEMCAAIVPALASGRRGITGDLRGHARTADADRPLRFQTMGDDIAALIGRLGLGQGAGTDVMGYSLGAGVA